MKKKPEFSEKAPRNNQIDRIWRTQETLKEPQGILKITKGTKTDIWWRWWKYRKKMYTNLNWLDHKRRAKCQPGGKNHYRSVTFEFNGLLHSIFTYYRTNLHLLDKTYLSKCREVAKSWQKSIDNRNILWLKIVEKNRRW